MVAFIVIIDIGLRIRRAVAESFLRCLKPGVPISAVQNLECSNDLFIRSALKQRVGPIDISYLSPHPARVR
jgi:hypothetical protein